ncbi:hypothetical protein K461DRAFT_324036 [Myriangium duriaei CBS 260.36]|uniref:Rhodopsin domain-containing protein n=1 Tax=Myriangium duriaei CBS 260.36 TaxID=1168546 RepID=A0A9P4IVI8_9PEZI|nr:hypothetical protein K461DRAFT_324036 [Myriangium duriaei CBS 260.36]
MSETKSHPRLTSRGITVTAISSALLGICFLTFGLRIYSARERKNQPGWRWDLIWVTITILFGLAAFAFQVKATVEGLGHHVNDLDLNGIVNTVYLAFVSIELYIVAGAFAKLSIVALLISIQGIDAKRRKAFLIFLGAFQAIMNLVLTLLIAFECRPISKLWKPWESGVCPGTLAGHWFSYAQGGVSALTDWTLGLWPLTMISTLHISKKSKLSFCLLIGIGIIPGIASVCRAIVTHHAVSSVDYTYTYPLVICWTTVEIWLILILGSAPSLRPLVMRWFGLGQHKQTYARTTSNVGHTTHTRRTGSHVATMNRIEGVEVDGLDEYKGNLTVSCAAVVIEEAPEKKSEEKEVV